MLCVPFIYYSIINLSIIYCLAPSLIILKVKLCNLPKFNPSQLLKVSAETTTVVSISALPELPERGQTAGKGPVLDRSRKTTLSASARISKSAFVFVRRRRPSRLLVLWPLCLCLSRASSALTSPQRRSRPLTTSPTSTSSLVCFCKPLKPS